MIWIKRYIEKVNFVQKNIMSVLESVCHSMNSLSWSADEGLMLVRDRLFFTLWDMETLGNKCWDMLADLHLFLTFTEHRVMKKGQLKMGHSSNFLYQGMLRSIFQLSAYIAKLKTKRKLVVSVHLIVQWSWPFCT